MIIVFILLFIHTSESSKDGVKGKNPTNYTAKDSEALDPDIEVIFNRKSDDILSEMLGDVHAYKRNLDAKLEMYTTNITNIRRSFRHQKPSVKKLPKSTTSTTEQNVIKLTPSPVKSKPDPEFLKFIRLRMLRRDLSIILRENHTQIPLFNNNDDDPLSLTKKFDLDATNQSQNVNKTRRVQYFEQEEHRDYYGEKWRIENLMRQFIYMSRYKMSVMSLLRKKYKNLNKYKIGYLFGLSRMVKHQQRTMYSTLREWYKTFNNPQIVLQLYYKIVKLDIDLDDLSKYIRKLDAMQKLVYNPYYFDDSSEYYSFRPGDKHD